MNDVPLHDNIPPRSLSCLLAEFINYGLMANSQKSTLLLPCLVIYHTQTSFENSYSFKLVLKIIPTQLFVMYEQITGPLVRSVALKPEGATGHQALTPKDGDGDASAPPQFNIFILLQY